MDQESYRSVGRDRYKEIGRILVFGGVLFQPDWN
jgi:hypothetical protein